MLTLTSNQIAYWQLQEDKRTNRAKEAEAYRSNTAKETETNRHNLADEYNRLISALNNPYSIYAHKQGGSNNMGTVDGFRDFVEGNASQFLDIFAPKTETGAPATGTAFDGPTAGMDNLNEVSEGNKGFFQGLIDSILSIFK